MNYRKYRNIDYTYRNFSFSGSAAIGTPGNNSNVFAQYAFRVEMTVFWHLFPRVNGDIENYGNHGRGPVWWYPMEKMYSDDNKPSEEQLADMKSRLLKELEKLLAERF